MRYEINSTTKRIQRGKFISGKVTVYKCCTYALVDTKYSEGILLTK